MQDLRRIWLRKSCGPLGQLRSREVNWLSTDFRSIFAARERVEDTDIVVALIRAAVIIALLVVPPDTRGLINAPPFMQAMLVIGILFTFLLAALFFGNYTMHPYRPLALLIDLLLVTAITTTFWEDWPDLFQIYYLVVITAAVWYRRSGAIITALLAIVLGFAVEHATTDYDWQVLAAEFSVTRVPLLLLVAFITGYLVRARDAEHALNIEIDHELRLARRLQSAMLPDQIPETPELDISLTFRPARYVGGDFYSIRMLGEGRLLLVLADMAGKSVYGLVHLSALNSHLVAAVHEGLSPAQMAVRINRGIYPALHPDSYAALFIATIEIATGKVEFVNCGHLPPLLIRPGDSREVVELSSGGILIGAIEDPDYEMRTEQLDVGDIMVFYTDGISEVRNKHKEEFGTSGVLAAVEAVSDESAAMIADSIITAHEAFSVAHYNDDATLIVLRRQAPETSAN